MKQHRYRVTVEHLAHADGTPSHHPAPLRFDVGNHDEMLAIVERLRQRDDLPPDSAAPLAIGLKLFSEVMLEHRGHPLFAEFAPHFRDFMKRLKQGPAPAGTAS